jgi:hypothetical protein
MSALVLPLAHAGHWINGFLYLSPVLIIGLLLFIQSRRESGEDLDDDPEPEDPADSDV